MAFLHPRNLASRSDVPERLQMVARTLRDFLPDEVTVYLERTGGGDAAAAQLEFAGMSRVDTDEVEAYLVLIDQQAGIVVLEAPPRSRLRSNRRGTAKPKARSGLLARFGFRQPTDGAPEQISDPQPAAEQNQIRRMIAERASGLREGLDRSSIRDLPVVHALAMPRMQAHEAERLCPGWPVLTSEDFTRDALRPALLRIVGGARRRPLSKLEENATRATVNPTIVIDSRTPQMFTAAEGSGEDLIRVLDREQERLARDLGPGYRMIRGVAGSGKTLVITHRAMHMARLLPDWRFLVLCFNRPLRFSLAEELSEFGNVTVRNLDSLAYDLINNPEIAGNLEIAGNAGAGQPTPRNSGTGSRSEAGSGFGFDFNKQRLNALEAARQMDDSYRYDMVLVDEAQDLDNVGLDLAWAMLKPGRGHFVMALDSAQALHRRKMTWNPPEMTAQGRTTIMNINYRNTAQVLDIGLQVLLGGNIQHDRGKRDDGRRRLAQHDLDELVMPDKAVRSGPEPELLTCADHKAEVEAIARKVAQLRSSGVAADDIAILLGSFKIGSFKMKERVMQSVPDAFDINATKGSSRKNRDRAAFVKNRVRVASLNILKGLEFKHVIVGCANHIQVMGEPADTQNDDLKRRNLYIALTRATETATIVYSGSGLLSGMNAADIRSDHVQAHPTPSPQHSPQPLPPPPRMPSPADSRIEKASTAKPYAVISHKTHGQARRIDEKTCYQLLKQWRLKRSKADGVPAYIVFNDKVMAELARHQPVTDKELLRIPGIGSRKLKSYGSDLKRLFTTGQQPR